MRASLGGFYIISEVFYNVGIKGGSYRQNHANPPFPSDLRSGPLRLTLNIAIITIQKTTRRYTSMSSLWGKDKRIITRRLVPTAILNATPGKRRGNSKSSRV